MADQLKPRRTILQVLAASGTVAAIGGVASGQLTDDDDTDAGGEEQTVDAQTTDYTVADLTIDPDEPGATATYTLTATIGDDIAGDSLNELVCEFQEDSIDVSNVSEEKVSATLEGEDATDEIDAITVADAGRTITLSAGGTSLETGDRLRLVTECVQNPDEAGEYEVSITLDSESATRSESVTVTVGDGGDE